MIDRRIAKCQHFDLGVDDGCGKDIVLHGYFEFEDGDRMNMRHLPVNLDFIKCFLAVFKANRLGILHDKLCFVTCDFDRVYKIEPMFTQDGTTFDIVQWERDLRDRI